MRQTTGGCQLLNSCELATGNQQPDANSIFEGLKGQLYTKTQILMNWQQETGNKIPIRFEGFKQSKPNVKPAKGSKMPFANFFSEFSSANRQQDGNLI